MKHSKQVSASIDEYIEEMYRCNLNKKPITTKNLAQKLKISMPSVSEMLPKLRERNLILYQPRKEIKLTKKGKKLGLNIYKKHETIKKFFIMLGLGKKKATEQACRIEHELSDVALKKLELFLKKLK
ncbi:MAG: metal-dependent transcriptional regulator [Candidatus Micrarchaeota archaeon]